ncbi:MAG TPA: hypothetical protein VKI61_02525 [Chitinophagaceae bacterium]|jgi:hypothetical protein|nr:hypothetical protein [Chitinophagaceae bacterium]
MIIKEKISLTAIFIFAISGLFGQNRFDSLFASDAPLHIAFSISFKEVRDSKKDSTYLKTKLYYQNFSGKSDSIKVGIKGRGNYRLRECYYPPLWLKINKSNAKGTVFEGNKKLKLVLPCDNRTSSNALIIREYLCYKLYEEITPYAFLTRLADIDLTELGKNKNKLSNVKGIFIEDVEKTAVRLHAKTLKNIRMAPSTLNDTSAARFELFQYLISNTDWSVPYQHNSKLFAINSNNYFSIPYDFDMSGIVDAPYAVVSEVNGELLDISHVTERLYRGYCHPAEVMDYVRKEYLSKEERLLSVPDQLKGYLPEKEIKRIKDYMQEFFVMLKDTHLFRFDILDKCRTK